MHSGSIVCGSLTSTGFFFGSLLWVYHLVLVTGFSLKLISKESSYVTLDHKTSLKCQFFKIEICTLSEINKLSIDVWFVMIGQYLAEI